MLDITSSSTSGPLAITASVVEGTADIGIQGVNNMLTYAYNGWYDFEGKPYKNLRNLIMVGGMHVSLVTVPRTGIKTFDDLKGKRIAWYTASVNDNIEAQIRMAGIDPEKEIIRVNVPSMAEAHEEMRVGRIDAASTALLPSGSLLELQEAAGGIWFLPVDKQQLLEGKAKFPKAFAGIVPGVYQPFMQPALKIEKPVTTWLLPIGVACLDSLDEEAAYIYVKTILENVEEVKALNPTLKGFSFEQAASTVFEVPYHEGAIRAFKEKGLWTEEQEQFQQKFFK